MFCFCLGLFPKEVFDSGGGGSNRGAGRCWAILRYGRCWDREGSWAACPRRCLTLIKEIPGWKGELLFKEKSFCLIHAHTAQALPQFLYIFLCTSYSSLIHTSLYQFLPYSSLAKRTSIPHDPHAPPFPPACAIGRTSTITGSHRGQTLNRCLPGCLGASPVSPAVPVRASARARAHRYLRVLLVRAS